MCSHVCNSLPADLQLNSNSGIEATTQNSTVESVETTAHSDFLFFHAPYKYSYLLTYNIIRLQLRSIINIDVLNYTADLSVWASGV